MGSLNTNLQSESQNSHPFILGRQRIKRIGKNKQLFFVIFTFFYILEVLWIVIYGKKGNDKKSLKIQILSHSKKKQRFRVEDKK